MTDTLELIDLEELVNEDVPCIAKHVNPPCSIEVTHHLRWCSGGGPICGNAARSIVAKIESTKVKCAQCRRQAGECWKVVPL